MTRHVTGRKAKPEQPRSDVGRQLALFEWPPPNPSPWLGQVELPIRFTAAMWAACRSAAARDPYNMEWWRIGVLEGRYVREE